MALIRDFALQSVEMLLVLLLSPLLIGFCAQGESAIVAPKRPAANPTLSRPATADA
jgi:hypothetical protein